MDFIALEHIAAPPCKQTDRGLRTNWYQHIPGVKEWRKKWDERKRVQSHVLIHCVLDIWDQKEKYRVFNRSRQQACQTEELWGQSGHTGTILSCPEGRKCTWNCKAQKKETRKTTKKTPKRWKKQDTRKRRSETGKWWKRPRLDQTIPYRGLVYATRVSDELGSGADRSFLLFIFFPWNSGNSICNWLLTIFFFYKTKKTNPKSRKKNKSQVALHAGTARYRGSRRIKSDEAPMSFWPRALGCSGISLPCRFNYHRLGHRMVVYIGKGQGRRASVKRLYLCINVSWSIQSFEEK